MIATESRARVESALEALAQRRMIVVTDDVGREDEGDLVAIADGVSDETIAFMARCGRGLVCVPVTADRARRLALPPMVVTNEEPHRTAFTVTVDAARGITTGISAQDRAHTVRTMMEPTAAATDLVRPGHVFPLIARDGGVLERPGHTEAAVDLARLSGHAPGGVICEILADDGRALRGAALAAFCRSHRLPLVAIDDLIAYRRTFDEGVRRSVAGGRGVDGGAGAQRVVNGGVVTGDAPPGAGYDPRVVPMRTDSSFNRR